MTAEREKLLLLAVISYTITPDTQTIGFYREELQKNWWRFDIKSAMKDYLYCWN